MLKNTLKDIIWKVGRVWLNALDLKSNDALIGVRGFESLTFRQWESRSNPRFLFVCVKGVAGLIVKTQKVKPKTTYLIQPRDYQGQYIKMK